MAYTIGLVYLALLLIHKIVSELLIVTISATLAVVIIATIIAAKGEKRKNE